MKALTVFFAVYLAFVAAKGGDTSDELPADQPNFALRRHTKDGELITHVHWRRRWTVETVNERPTSDERHR